MTRITCERVHLISHPSQSRLFHRHICDGCRFNEVMFDVWTSLSAAQTEVRGRLAGAASDARAAQQRRQSNSSMADGAKPAAPLVRTPSMLAIVKSVTALDHVLHNASSSPASAAQLSMRLHDIYQRAAAAREMIRLTQERRKEEQRDEFRAMLLGIKPPSPDVLEQMRQMGSPRKAGMPDSKQLDEEDLRYRREFRERKAREKAEKAAKLKAENAAMRARIKGTKAATDNDASDDATGAARLKAAKEAAQRRALSMQAMAQKNAEMKARIASTGAATDNDVSDDATGAARRAAAKASKQRKAEEAAQLAEENSQLLAMIRSTGAATDNDVSDDAIGEARRKAAKDAKDAKDREAAAIKAQNAAMKARIASTGAATDNDVRDDATGVARQAAARAAVENRQAATEALTNANVALGARLGAIGVPSAIIPVVKVTTPKKKDSPKSSKSPKAAKEKAYLAMPPGAAPSSEDAILAAVTVVPPPPAALAKARSHKPPPEEETSKRGKSASSRAPKGDDETSRQDLAFRPDLEFKPKSVNLVKSDLEQQIHLDEWLDQLAIEAKGVSGASEYDTPRIW